MDVIIHHYNENFAPVLLVVPITPACTFGQNSTKYASWIVKILI